MTPEQDAMMLEAMNRMGARLVEKGFAKRFMTFDKTGKGGLVLTDSGLGLKGEVQRIFDFPNTKPEQIPVTDFAALYLLLLIPEPKFYPPKV